MTKMIRVFIFVFFLDFCLEVWLSSDALSFYQMREGSYAR